MSYRRLTKPGFSLMELLLYVGLSGTVVVLYSVLLFSAQSSREKSETALEVNEQLRFAMSAIERDVLDADSLDYPLPGNASSSLYLSSQDVARNPVVFRLDSGRIYQDEGASSSPLTSQRVLVESLDFNASTIGSSTVIQAAITMRSHNPSGRQENEYSQSSTSTLVWR
jgi:type II secretory pathway pseudopilin PulG